MICTLAGQKGGSGKTTVAISIADELHRRGDTVLIIDTDPQGTVSTWSAQRENAEDGPTVRAWPQLLNMKPSAARAEFARVAADFDHVVIDPPPKADRSQVVLLALADVAIVPCGPGHQDVWSLAESFALVSKVADRRDGLTARVLVNQADRTVLSREIAELLQDAPLPPFETHLGAYVAFRDAIGKGLGVTRYAPDTTAAEQVRTLTDEILNL